MKNNISKILFFLAFGALAFGQSFEGSVSGGVSQLGNVNLGGGYRSTADSDSHSE